MCTPGVASTCSQPRDCSQYSQFIKGGRIKLVWLGVHVQLSQAHVVQDGLGPLVVTKHFRISTALLLVFLYFLYTTTAKKAKGHNAWHKAAEDCRQLQLSRYAQASHGLQTEFVCENMAATAGLYPHPPFLDKPK